MTRSYEAVYIFDSVLEEAAVTEKLDRFHALIPQVEGAEFARIYFSIWLGENNPYKEFRDRLVGLK